MDFPPLKVSINRRQAIAGIAGAAFATANAHGKDEKSFIIDTHLHCFAGGASKNFPYHEDAPYRPEAPATPEHLLKLMTEAGVDRAIVVHPEPYQDDHRYLEHCLKVGKGKLKGTCLFFAGRPKNEENLKKLASSVPLVALRIHAYNPERLPPFGKPELKAMWKLAADFGLAVQLHFEPRYAAGFTTLIQEFPKVPVLVDHLGRPFQGTAKEHETVLNWSRWEHVTVKLSSLPNNNSYPHRKPDEIVQILLKRFGASRLMYGGGYSSTATAVSYKNERDRLVKMLGNVSEAEVAQILGGNARKLFQF
jgi:predicted TIM-barrel fold metal-dependent hydrolase